MTLDDVMHALMGMKTTKEQFDYVNKHATEVGNALWELFPERGRVTYRYIMSRVRENYRYVLDLAVARRMREIMRV